MTGDFDPYYKWLGIPPRDQPPHHYRLLGIELFETDREVIDAAANRLMGYLKDLAVGDESAHSQQLLNEIARARLCLLNEERKAAYDGQLRDRLKAEGALEGETRKPSAKGPPPKAHKRSVPPPAVPPSAAAPPARPEPPSSPKPPTVPAPPFDPAKMTRPDQSVPAEPVAADPVEVSVRQDDAAEVKPAADKDQPPVQEVLQRRRMLAAVVLIAVVGGVGLVLIAVMSVLLLTSKGGTNGSQGPVAPETGSEASELVLEMTDQEREEVTEFQLDDVPQPLPPASRHELEPGRHIIRLKRPGYDDYYNSVTLLGGRPTRCTPEWRPGGTDAPP